VYWEERRKLKPSYNVLVAGLLDADAAGSFYGEWLSSLEGMTNANVERSSNDPTKRDAALEEEELDELYDRSYNPPREV
jgi:hypothetical protein